MPLAFVAHDEEKKLSMATRDAAKRLHRTVVLMCGASHMGKSYFSRQLLAVEYAAVYRHVDRLYTSAVVAADMVPTQDSEIIADRRRGEKDARRFARDRKWPSDHAKTAFFSCLEDHFRAALAEGLRRKAPVVLEGGSLRFPDELEIVTRSAKEIFGLPLSIVRIAVEIPYERWVVNRLNRAVKSGLETISTRKLSPEQYRREAHQAAPKPFRGIADYKIAGADELRTLLDRLGA